MQAWSADRVSFLCEQRGPVDWRVSEVAAKRILKVLRRAWAAAELMVRRALLTMHRAAVRWGSGRLNLRAEKRAQKALHQPSVRALGRGPA